MSKMGGFGKKALIGMLIVGLLVGLGAGYAVLPRQTEEIVAYTPSADNSPSFLFVQQATSGSFIPDANADTYTLTLNDVDAQVKYFSDRPQRISGQNSMEAFVAEWDSHGFGETPPNAALVLQDAESQEDTLIVELTNPIYNSQTKTLQYTAKVLSDSQSERLASHVSMADGYLPEQFGRVNLFVDDAKSIGDTVTVSYTDAFHTTWETYSIAGAVVAVDDSAKAYLSRVGVNTLKQAFVDHKLTHSGVVCIGEYGTVIGSDVTEFDVYYGLTPGTQYAHDINSITRVYGYSITIQGGVKAAVISPYTGVVSSSGDWIAQNGTEVNQDDTLFYIESTTGRAFTLQISDLIDGVLPLGVTAEQIFVN